MKLGLLLVDKESDCGGSRSISRLVGVASEADSQREELGFAMR
jgi:hypothetical protein